MSVMDDDTRLPDAAEKLLRDWPAPERDSLAWDDSAEAVAEAIAAAKGDRTSDALLAPPLPAEDGEEGFGEDERPPVSLADMARASLDAAKEEDGSFDDIAKESLSVAKRSRNSVPSIPDSVRQSAARIAAQAAEVPAPVPSAPAPVKKKGSAGPWVAGVITLVGLAAAVLIVVKQRADEPPPWAAGVASATATSVAQAEAPAAKPAAPDDIVPLEDLGAETKGTPRESAAKMAAAGPAPKAKPGATEEAPAANPAPATKPDQESEEDKEFAKKSQPAAQPGDLPEKPSAGAVQAAVSAPLGGARACVAGHDAPSRATVTFGSNGRVQSVGVSGPAAGTPAESCIRAALSKARVQPFARPSFSVGVTVRP
jgi:hypothetical protein